MFADLARPEQDDDARVAKRLDDIGPNATVEEGPARLTRARGYLTSNVTCWLCPPLGVNVSR